MMEIITSLMFMMSFTQANVPKEIKLIPFENLKDSAWKPLHWADRPFIFLSYGGDWSKSSQRVAHECKVKGLLNPKWEEK